MAGRPFLPAMILVFICFFFSSPICLCGLCLVASVSLYLILLFVLGVSGAGTGETEDQVTLRFLKEMFGR